jgi:acyl dehydratase
MIDPSWIGTSLPPATLRVESGRLAFFNKATGNSADKEPQVAPPTFLFSAYTDSNVYFDLLDKMEVPHQRLLHGEQNFEYFAPLQVGDEIRVQGRIVDITNKKNGALEFVEITSDATNQADILVARLSAVLVIRNPGVT